ncbi:hypothetical protein J1N35_029432 [Gossypium stocksii]|uniref:Uncharacterized protein n=1 Tax=Gossypium stocksii TaxID=47602 RepID=A0A9D3UY92_9ROSI|nr:hypothetical protein J1N35_029432 [Gossypium stocksii]
MADAFTVTTTITNDSGQDLKLRCSDYEIAAKTINNKVTATFPVPVPANYKVGFFVYDVGDSPGWMVFWTTDNQVFTMLFKISDTIPREQAASNPRQGHSEHEIIYPGYKYTAWARIETNADGQALTANISHAE